MKNEKNRRLYPKVFPSLVEALYTHEMSLEVLSVLTDTSNNTLEKIQQGKRVPSLKTKQIIEDALGY